nr:MAG TPA: hypothetical protein [Caudoviricetes sp.]
MPRRYTCALLVAEGRGASQRYESLRGNKLRA